MIPRVKEVVWQHRSSPAGTLRENPKGISWWAPPGLGQGHSVLQWRLWRIGRKPPPDSMAGRRIGPGGSDLAQSPAETVRGWRHALVDLDRLIGDLGFGNRPVARGDGPWRHP